MYLCIQLIWLLWYEALYIRFFPIGKLSSREVKTPALKQEVVGLIHTWVAGGGFSAYTRKTEYKMFHTNPVRRANN